MYQTTLRWSPLLGILLNKTRNNNNNNQIEYRIRNVLKDDKGRTILIDGEMMQKNNNKKTTTLLWPVFMLLPLYYQRGTLQQYIHSPPMISQYSYGRRTVCFLKQDVSILFAYVFLCFFWVFFLFFFLLLKSPKPSVLNVNIFNSLYSVTWAKNQLQAIHNIRCSKKSCV